MVNGGNSVLRAVKGISANQLVSQFQTAAQSQFSGQLDFRVSSEQTWSLYFRLGRLIWTASSDHRFRRWYRLLKQFCPTIQPNALRLREQGIPFYWEYLVLSVLLKRQHVSPEQVIALIQAAALEVLFDLLYSSEQITQSGYTYDKQEQFGDPLAPLNAEQLLAYVQKAWNDWHSAGLVHYSPNAVPVIKRPPELQQCVTAKTYQVLEAQMNGATTLRDLATATGQELLTLTRVLAPHIQRDLIELRRMPDFPSPGFAGSPTVKVAPPSTNAPLIVCIDDSLPVCDLMEQIARAAGYRCMSVQDSVHALPLLLEHKPGLIFLDLVMPIASGYEICSQIRRISAFKHIPVVILTGNDGIVDRVRARMVGASDFLAKPVNAEKVLAIARQYLPIPAPDPAASRQVPISQPFPGEDAYEMGEATAFLLKETIKNVSGSS